MTIHKKRLLSAVLALALLFAPTACATQEPAGADGDADVAAGEVQDAAATRGVKIKASEDINAMPLVDLNHLYETYEKDSLVTMYLTVRQGSAAENTNHFWREVSYDFSVYDYERMGVPRYQVLGLLQVGDENGPRLGELGFGETAPNATVQIRGQTSSLGKQKSFKIKIKDGKGSWREQTTLAMNKHVNDITRFRNKLMYDLMVDVPDMMSARTQFVQLYVKDQTVPSNIETEFTDYGLFTLVEQINKTYLRNHNLDRNGHLYKINFFEFREYEEVKLQSDSTFDLDAFEQLLEIKGNTDHQKLIDMLADINNYSLPIEEVFDYWFDVDNILTWMAFHMITGNTDTQSRNVYLYSPLQSHTWYFISWDNDVAFSRGQHALTGYSDAAGFEEGVSNYWGNVLFQRVLKSEKYREILDEKMQMMRGIVTEERIAELIALYEPVIEPHIARMPDMQNVATIMDVRDQVVQGIPAEVHLNYQLYEQSLKKPMPFFMGVPAIIKNENQNKMEYYWDPAYDFNGETVTYTFEVARDYEFTDVIIREDQLLLPYTETDLLPFGQYFLRVTATNESGYSQMAFDYYVIESVGKLYGVKCFYISADGEVEEDEYVEG